MSGFYGDKRAVKTPRDNRTLFFSPSAEIGSSRRLKVKTKVHVDKSLPAFGWKAHIKL